MVIAGEAPLAQRGGAAARDARIGGLRSRCVRARVVHLLEPNVRA